VRNGYRRILRRVPKQILPTSVKTVAFLKRKSGMPRAAFIDYYETRHAPLILELAPQISAYRRNYLVEAGAILAQGVEAPDFDVVTELYYADREAFAAAMRAFTEPRNAARIASDEENLFDRSKTRFYVVEERASPI
jgi:uncharacterized protein (TIGR02118 family)